MELQPQQADDAIIELTDEDLVDGAANPEPAPQKPPPRRRRRTQTTKPLPRKSGSSAAAGPSSRRQAEAPPPPPAEDDEGEDEGEEPENTRRSPRGRRGRGRASRDRRGRRRADPEQVEKRPSGFKRFCLRLFLLLLFFLGGVVGMAFLARHLRTEAREEPVAVWQRNILNFLDGGPVSTLWQTPQHADADADAGVDATSQDQDPQDEEAADDEADDDTQP
jgi:hypothetical protein